MAAGEAFAKLAHVSAALKVSNSRRAVSVGCIPSIASRWLVPRLPEFARMHPDIPVQVCYAKADDRLRDADYDVLITLGEDGGRGVENTKLFSRENKPVCSRYFNLLATALLAGHGVALCPVQVFRNEIANGDLVVLSEIATLEDRGYFITIPRGADSSRKAFRDWFGASISSDAAA